MSPTSLLYSLKGLGKMWGEHILPLAVKGHGYMVKYFKDWKDCHVISMSSQFLSATSVLQFSH